MSDIVRNEFDKTTSRNNFDRNVYWQTRKHLVYYHVVEKYVRYVGRHAKSLLDVGGTSPFIERFDWIGELHTLDIAQPYISERVTSTKMDFFEYDPGRRFDVITCLQVLEHLDNPTKACRRMAELSDHLIVSVPFKWDPATTRKAGHVQDPVSIKKLNRWMGKKPVDRTIVNEPFLPRWPRLVAWYSFTDEVTKVDLKMYRESQN